MRSRNKVVEPMGKTPLVLDMVDVQLQVHDSGSYGEITLYVATCGSRVQPRPR